MGFYLKIITGNFFDHFCNPFLGLGLQPQLLNLSLLDPCGDWFCVFIKFNSSSYNNVWLHYIFSGIWELITSWLWFMGLFSVPSLLIVLLTEFFHFL